MRKKTIFSSKVLALFRYSGEVTLFPNLGSTLTLQTSFSNNCNCECQFLFLVFICFSPRFQDFDWNTTKMCWEQLHQEWGEKDSVAIYVSSAGKNTLHSFCRMYQLAPLLQYMLRWSQAFFAFFHLHLYQCPLLIPE